MIPLITAVAESSVEPHELEIVIIFKLLDSNIIICIYLMVLKTNKTIEQKLLGSAEPSSQGTLAPPLITDTIFFNT